MRSKYDPLKIYYVVVLEDDPIEHTSVFQGFSRSWRNVMWVFNLLVGLPANIFEKTFSVENLLTLRVGGLAQLSWIPLNISALESTTKEELGYFIVCFSGHPNVAERINAWTSKQKGNVLHISSVAQGAAIKASNFDISILHGFCRQVFVELKGVFTPEVNQQIDKTLNLWIDDKYRESGLITWNHNVTVPNMMALKRASRSFANKGPFVGRSEDEYVNIIIESAKAVRDVWNEIDYMPVHRETLLQPSLFLVEPALYRRIYKAAENGNSQIYKKILRIFRKQKTLCNRVDSSFFDDLENDETAKFLIGERSWETQLFGLAVGLKTSQICASTIRLSPDVNHVFPLLLRYADHIRSTGVRQKSAKLFEDIQKYLLNVVGERRVNFIKNTKGPIKIIADAPIELLPIGNLPLGLKYDCSRINVTPGNLMMALLSYEAGMVLHPNDMRKVLIISSFEDDDPLKGLLLKAIDVVQVRALGIEIIERHVQTEKEFIEAVNAYDGKILIFDGHGAGNFSDDIGTICVGNHRLDPWKLRDKLKVPPIVILSACDTHNFDGLTHATVGNGFLAIGALTVLATSLPIEGYKAAEFIARLLYRLVEFVPAALQARKRVLNWSEIISGMLRMLLASEILNCLVGPPAAPDEPRGKIQLKANIDINTGDEDWFDNLIKGIAEYHGAERNAIEKKVLGVLARSQSLRYTQLGFPEYIVINDGSVDSSLHIPIC